MCPEVTSFTEVSTNVEKGKINKIEGDIPPDLYIPEESDLLVIGDDQNALTHGFHKYPAKYIPEFPRWAIKKYSNEGDTVLDPFAGSGTTNIEAMLLNRDSLAIDIDPLALLLIRVKSTPIKPDLISTKHKDLLNRIDDSDLPSKKLLPNFKNRDHWFEIDISKKLALIKRCIEKESNKDIKNLFLVSFSSIIRKVSNADQGSHKPCVRKGRDRNIPDPIETFKNSLEENVKKSIQFYKEVKSNTSTVKIVKKDARNINISNESVDLAVTSPPYINALDYPRTHKLEYYWLGYYNDSLVDLKKEFVGTEKVYADQYKNLHKTGIDGLDTLIEKIYETDKKRAYIVYKYYKDMEDNLQETYRTLKNKGRYIIFIGSNQIRGFEIQNFKYIKSLSQRIGFRIDNYFKSRVINHYIPFDRVEKIDKDYVLVLQK